MFQVAVRSFLHALLLCVKAKKRRSVAQLCESMIVRATMVYLCEAKSVQYLVRLCGERTESEGE